MFLVAAARRHSWRNRGKRSAPNAPAISYALDDLVAPFQIAEAPRQTMTPMAKALPVICWQSVQWQV